jgi:site-specific DNA-methyltransferase (adenine-specific)
MVDITLNHGDCMVGMKELKDKSVDMVCCDLPYGITGNKWDSVLDLDAVFKEYIRIIKDDGAIVLFSCQPFTTDLINAGRKWFRYEIIWDKNIGSDFFNVHRKPLRSHENILVFSKKNTKYNPQMEQGKPYKRKQEPNKKEVISSLGEGRKFRRRVVDVCNNGTRFPKTVLKFKKESGFHTTQKSVPLLEWLVKTYTNDDDLVVDNTMGSGSCAIACLNTKRRFVGWELDENIYKTAVLRKEEHVKKIERNRGDPSIVSDTSTMLPD